MATASSSARSGVVEPRGAGEHGVADGLGDLGVGGREHLGHVERVAGGPAMQLGGVDADRAGQLGHPLGGERRQRQSRRRAAGQLAEDDPQRVARIELVVAIGDEHQRGEPLDAPGEQAQDVERGLVGPVEVLEDDDVRRPRAQRSRQRPDEGAGSGALGHRRAELAAHLVGDVHEGAERARGEERVARAPQDSALTRSRAERPHERRLADPRLTGDQHEPSAALFADRARWPSRASSWAERSSSSTVLVVAPSPIGTCSPLRVLDRQRSSRLVGCPCPAPAPLRGAPRWADAIRT